MRHDNLRSAFLDYVQERPDDVAVRCAFNENAVTRGELYSRAVVAANELLAHGVGHGDRYLLALDNGTEFAVGFWAGQLIGAVVIPVPQIESGRRRQSALDSVNRIVSVTAAKLIIVRRQDLVSLQPEELKCVAIEGDAPFEGNPHGNTLPRSEVGPDDLAILQFSSGSTSFPKGCALPHRAVCANARAAADRFDGKPGDTFYNWLPQYHDLGLMGGVIAPVVIGMTAIVQPTRRFVFDPLSWLRGLDSAGPVHTSAPNFGLNLVVKRLGARERLAFDLSRVKALICGGEPIHPITARDFLDAVSTYGFKRDAFFPSYGLAESTVLVTAKSGLTVSIPPSTHSSLIANGRQLGTALPNLLGSVVNLGRPVLGAEIRIRAPNSSIASDREVGTVEIKSESLMIGYFNEDRKTSESFADGWLLTGDLGYLENGELYCVGRVKDVIIVAGRNLIGPEIDRYLSKAVSIEPTRIACFGSFDGTEGLCVAFESRSQESIDLARAISEACFVGFGVTPMDTFAVQVGAIPKTTSGKVKRMALAEYYHTQRSQSRARVLTDDARTADVDD